MNTPTTGISKFLDKLIRPLFDKYVRSTTIIDGVDLVRPLETYVEYGYIKPTIQLCTFDITDLHKMKAIPIGGIRKLARLVITENVFIYEKKFYQQIIGGAMGSAFTFTLINIFMWKWEK